MPARPIPADLQPWAQRALGLTGVPESCGFKVVAGDASNRRYFRLHTADGSFIVVDAPPATEKNAEFAQVHALLDGAGVKVPQLLAVDLDRGYMVLEDLGDQMLLPALNENSVAGYYAAATEILARFRRVDIHQSGLAPYDANLLGEELSRFRQWFVEALLGHTCDEEETALIDAFSSLLIEEVLQQPRVFVHRDFHSRNLMLTTGGDLAIIDFQDAVCGPVTYDLASLLKDCYIRWPRADVCRWALAYRDELVSQGEIAPLDDEVFLRWFDLMALQRHIKVLGTFARLYLRDGKAGYLDDLPMVFGYVQEALQIYAASEQRLADFASWFEERVSPLIAAQPWARSQ